MTTQICSAAGGLTASTLVQNDNGRAAAALEN
jgi:hypothetical protein